MSGHGRLATGVPLHGWWGMCKVEIAFWSVSTGYFISGVVLKPLE